MSEANTSFLSKIPCQGIYRKIWYCVRKQEYKL